MFGNFSEEARKVFVLAKKYMLELHHPYVGSEHLMLAILKSSLAARLEKYNLTYDCFKKEVINVIGIGKNDSYRFLYTPLLKRVIETSLEDAKEAGTDIEVENLLSSILQEGEGVALRLMLGMKIDIEAMCDEFIYKVIPKNNKTILLSELGVDLTAKSIDSLDPLIGRDIELKRVIEILSRRTKNNPLLIGEAGVGKTAIVEGLASLIASDLVPKKLKGKKIISVDMASLVAGTKYRGEFEERMHKIIEEATNSDVILFIDEIHTLVGAGGAEGAIDASNIFKPALARGNIKVIGATTKEEYQKTIAKDKALSRRFQNVIVEMPDKDATKKILLGLKNIYEDFHNVIISSDIIDLIIYLTDKYIHNKYEPDKSIDILDEVCAYASLKENKKTKEYNKINKNLKETVKVKNELLSKEDYESALKYRECEQILLSKLNELELDMSSSKKNEVTKEDVAHIINMKTNIPIYEILEDNKKIIKNILNKLLDNIKGENDIVFECADMIKRIKLGFINTYSILFIGPEGVGKTTLATLISKELGTNFIKIDGSSLIDYSSITKILGSQSQEESCLLDEIKNNPYSLILIDDADLIHPNIMKVFMQILDEGKIKNIKGEYIYFNNVIFILTTKQEEANIGFKKNNDNNIFLTSKVDKVLIFKSLDIETIKCIAKEKLNILKKKYKSKKINVKIDSKVLESVIEMTDFEKHGVKALEKTIKDKIENIIINNILEGKSSVYIDQIVKINV